MDSCLQLCCNLPGRPRLSTTKPGPDDYACVRSSRHQRLGAIILHWPPCCCGQPLYAADCATVAGKRGTYANSLHCQPSLYAGGQVLALLCGLAFQTELLTACLWVIQDHIFVSSICHQAAGTPVQYTSHPVAACSCVHQLKSLLQRLLSLRG